jgi:steroid delta-isomerase-like uncharacterized protein
MRTERIVALISLVIAGCTGRATPPANWDSRIQAANEELLNKGNLAVITDVFAPVYIAHATGGDQTGGPEVIEGFVQALRSAFPDLRVEVTILATQGDRVAWLRTARGTHQGEFMGVPASGRAIAWREMVVTRFESDRIAEEWAVSDLGERLRVP